MVVDRVHAAFKFAKIDRRSKVGVTPTMLSEFKRAAQFLEEEKWLTTRDINLAIGTSRAPATL
jgi:hypothetical protein